MTRRLAAITIATVATLAGGTYWLARPAPTDPIDDIVVEEPADPVVQPLTVFFCCSSDGCEEIHGDEINHCPPSSDLVVCCGPASEPDGTVSCNC